MTNPQPVGPWRGENNVMDPAHVAFQPSESGADALSITDFDLDTSGWPIQRAGFSNLLSVASPMGLATGLGLILLQDGGRIKSLDLSVSPPTEQTVVSGLNPALRVSFLELADRLFWSNGEANGRILSDGTAVPWGLPTAPAPTLGVAAGTLRAGRYMVSATYEDSQGIEHSCPASSIIELVAPGAITVNLTPDPAAAAIRIYVSKTNGVQLFYNQTVTPGALPATITTADVSVEPLRTQHLSPPPLGTVLARSRGYCLIAKDNAVYPSVGVFHHLYDLTGLQEYFPSAVIGLVGVSNGFWTVTADHGAFWTQGGTPQEWNTQSRGPFRRFAAGGIALSGLRLPLLETPETVAVFVSENGLCFGLPTGQLVFPHQLRQHLDVANKRATIVWRRQPDVPRLSQILFTLES